MKEELKPIEVATDEAAERQRIADGIAQEKAQTEAIKAKETTVQSAIPVGQAENVPATPAAQSSVKESMAEIKDTVGKPSTVKSTVSTIGNIRGSGSTGYDVVGLRSANESQGSQSTTSANVSSGTTQQTQRTDFDPNKAAENVAAIDPFLEKVDKEGAAKAFLDVYGAKPTPDALNNAAELARKKNKIAVLSESLRVLFDMGAAAGGGNVYKRDQVQKNIAETKAELNKEEAKYQDAVDKFNQGLLGAKGADLGTKRALMNDAIKAGYSTTSQGKSDQSTVAGSNTTSKQSSIGKQEQAVTNQEYAYNKSLALGAASRGEKNTQIISTVVDPKTGQTREQLYTQFNPTEWAAVKPRARMYLAQNPKVIKDAATRYGVSEEIVKKVLAGKYSEEEKIGTKNGSISYEDLSDDLVRNFSMQDPRAKAVLDYRRNSQGIDKDNTRTGVVNGTIMDFTDNQQPINNSGVNIPWQPTPGNPNDLLDQLTTE